ncbi:MAG: bifunctional shikimate kinase/3-dehydroquinate synthase [Solirubrobacterales bacterium]
MAAIENRGSRPAIVFIGFMAAGKTRAAAAVAERLGGTLADTDQMLESTFGEPIREFFEREGEDAFRREEETLIGSLLGPGGLDDQLRDRDGDGPLVVALGGGAIEGEAVRDVLAGHLCVWCRVDPEVAWERASRSRARPLAGDRDAFIGRFEAREPLYEELARAILPSNAREAAGEAAPWLAALRELPQMRIAWAESAGGSYPAAVGPGALELLERTREFAPDLPARLFCVGDADAVAAQRALMPACEAVIEVFGGERSKTIAEAERILAALAEMGVRRDDGVLAFGGGVVGDLAGFCAATYQRGIPVVQAPTTLVAMVDSAYGGKTGVDLPAGKNYVGAYHQPLAVLADPRALATLPRVELAAGFVEVLKTALIAGGRLWGRVRELDSLDPDALADVIFDCARVKIEVVAADERDSGRRAVLNLGHTVGHAIEAASGYERYRHGEAVGLGLLAALRLSDAGELRAEVADRLAAQGLPTQLDREVGVDEVIAAVGRDKKATREGVGFVLLERPGEPRWGQRVDPDRVRAAVQELYG